ncbi:hypothetical protein QQ008_07315 [Fulvivirgaceae bacterium BMA10]|uniref:Uncharacterized protein n=1 Tax=Splendidivirga corallicola TaxID=3051826 RepID=A0ABT8KL54_9BACT|nr:hypothetical protein [Fulvivirgaceae bacterium BMA10]
MHFYIIKTKGGFTILKGDKELIKQEVLKHQLQVVALGDSLGKVLEQFSKSLTS